MFLDSMESNHTGLMVEVDVIKNLNYDNPNRYWCIDNKEYRYEINIKSSGTGKFYLTENMKAEM